MIRKVLALLRTFVLLLPLSLCIVSCEEFNLEDIFGNIIKPGGGEEKEFRYSFEENFEAKALEWRKL